MPSFTALRVHQTGAGTVARLETLSLDDLSPGNVVIRGEYSSINYKDALAITGKGRILRRFPLVAGVDIAGTVVSSGDARFRPGDPVAVHGCGLSETHDGGFSEYARVPGDWVNPLPPGMDARAAMSLGTAGFTAGLAIHRLEQVGQVPELGPIAVTGATGGVGSFAIAMLAGLGYPVTAVTGKATADDYLKARGATDIFHLQGATLGTKPLERPLWGGAIDNLGGDTLAWLTRTTVPLGNIASVGLAQGHELHTTVMPFILRGVSVLGINSVEVPGRLRAEVWRRLAGDLKIDDPGVIASREVGLADVPDVVNDWVEGRVTGRCLVRLT
ncbi:MAG: YhdH/YhfP family quinone oxidoreductase [Gammaproteobacteria bacterium]|nr:YhdH/YhfP family quinone oxidoreductase [Gammaproteobacteria bacterium]